MQGGITFVAVKGILKIYLKQRIYSLSGHRKIKDFDHAAHSPAAANTSNTNASTTIVNTTSTSNHRGGGGGGGTSSAATL